MAVAIREDDGTLRDPVEVVRPIRDNIRRAREHRKQYEPTWHQNMAFAAGQTWLVWDRFTRALRRISDVDPAYRGRELYSADLITEYRTTVLGELGSDDDRPQLLVAQEGKAQEEFQEAVNRALSYAWDHEFHGDEALAEVDRFTIDLGTAAMRCRFDPTQGKPRAEQVPFYGGKPMLDKEKARELMSEYEGGPVPGVEMRNINEGRIVWEPLSVFNLLPPPGVTHERYFPWEAIIRAVPLETLHDEYGEAADELTEDGDIASSLGTSSESGQSGVAYALGEARDQRLRDHAWLVNYYERPTPRRPQGRVFHFASNDLKLLRVDEELPCERSDGTRGSGISYFHWWRVTGRFWSRGLVDNLKDPQRTYAKRRTQENEIIDRGLPYVVAEEGSNVEREGMPLEIVRIPSGGRPPIPVPGIGPGPWMEQSLERIQLDMERASGVRGPTLGENPQNVATYSQLALLKESDAVKRQSILFDRKLAIKELVEATVYDMRTYWGSEKMVTLQGEEDTVSAEVFNASRIPDFYIVKVAKGTAQPRSQAAELQKINDLAQYSLNSRAPLPVTWLKESYEAAQAQELPQDVSVEQLDKAQLENHVLLSGQPVGVAYYDPPEVHIPVHRAAQIQADLSGDVAAVENIEQHIQLHMQAAQQAMAMVQAAREAVPPPQPEPVAPGGQNGPQAPTPAG